MNWKQSLGVAAIAMMAIGANAQTDTQSTVRVVVDGDRLRFRDEQPVVQNDRVLVPLRGIFERLGAHVMWDPSTQTVTAHKGGRTIKLGIGQDDASVNGRAVHLDVPAQLVGGSTMVPLRFVSESLGATVTWNDQQQEADITSPAGEPSEPPPPMPPRTPVIVRPPQGRPLRQTNMMVVSADSVIPMTLETRLSSSNARPGDQFTATLNTFGRGRYMDLPQGTRIYGTVSYVKARHGDDAGVIELAFDHLTTPSGHSFPIDGRLINLSGSGIVHGRNGEIVAHGTANDHVVFAGYGAGAGLIVGLAAHRPIEDAAIGGLLGAVVDATRRRHAQNVELTPGTQFGIRLEKSLVFPRDVR